MSSANGLILSYFIKNIHLNLFYQLVLNLRVMPQLGYKLVFDLR